jgi:low temperature requirement protein LtrA
MDDRNRYPLTYGVLLFIIAIGLVAAGVIQNNSGLLLTGAGSALISAIYVALVTSSRRRN